MAILSLEPEEFQQPKVVIIWTIVFSKLDLQILLCHVIINIICLKVFLVYNTSGVWLCIFGIQDLL